MASPHFTEEETEAQGGQGPHGFTRGQQGEPALGSFHTHLPSLKTSKGGRTSWAREGGQTQPMGQTLTYAF